MQTGFGEIMTEVTMLLLRVLSLIGQLYPKIEFRVSGSEFKVSAFGVYNC